jgi:2-iminobutanoate/2-iminopropanoate deaminase
MAISYNPPDVWRPFGAFSMMKIRGHGQTVDLKGQVALDKEGRIVGKNDMRGAGPQDVGEPSDGSGLGGR